MNTLRKRLNRLQTESERHTYVVVAGDRTTEDQIREAIHESGACGPFDVLHVVDAFGVPDAAIDIKLFLPLSLQETMRRSSAGEA